MALVDFLASMTGRMVRIVAGAALIAVGGMVLEGAVGIILVVIGLVPLLAGTFDFCVFAPLFGAPFSGRAIRKLRVDAGVEGDDYADMDDEYDEDADMDEGYDDDADVGY